MKTGLPSVEPEVAGRPDVAPAGLTARNIGCEQVNHLGFGVPCRRFESRRSLSHHLSVTVCAIQTMLCHSLAKPDVVETLGPDVLPGDIQERLPACQLGRPATVL